MRDAFECFLVEYHLFSIANLISTLRTTFASFLSRPNIQQQKGNIRQLGELGVKGVEDPENPKAKRAQKEAVCPREAASNQIQRTAKVVPVCWKS